MSEPVILETSRLILRPHRLDDFSNIVALWGNSDVTRFISGSGPSSQEECWQRLLRYHGLWPALGFGYFAVTSKHTGAFLGEAGLADFNRQITPSLDGFAEAGWALMVHARGNGYALEALSAIIKWYSTTPNPRPVACIISPDNAASIRLAQKVGFVLKAQTEYKGSPCMMFER
ncbi:MAG: GNAT family N-acetyltransferase [Rhizobiaceae bacterium]